MNEFSLSDAVNLYYKQVDISHKLWTYLQVVAGAAATLATAYHDVKTLLIVIFIGFTLFAVVNCYLLCLTQRDASKTGAAIRTAWPEPSEWSTILPAFDFWGRSQVVVLHVIIDIVVLSLVVVQWWRC
ncbi:MAG TPA: hypothetical protein VFC23_11205 [Thermoanaerobaculia bacterium]|nr:hypothetical protein [Thermoanaerobaculia bacterium]